MKHPLKSLRPAATIAAAALAGLMIASCSSSVDGTPKAASTVAAENRSPKSQIRQVTQEVLDAQNSGELSKIPALTCKKVLADLPPNPEDTEPAPQQVEIVEVGAIKIDGDTATATVTIAAKDDPTIPPRAEVVTYENEDGWKLCG